MRLSGAVLLVGTVGALACGCAGSGHATRSPSTPPAGAASPGPVQTFLLSDAPFPLTLSVSGKGKAIITYASGPGDPATRTTTGLPWTTTLNLSPNNAVISTTLTARNVSDTTDAWVSCKVTLAEAVLKEKSAKGPHAFADCSMTPTPQLRIPRPRRRASQRAGRPDHALAIVDTAVGSGRASAGRPNDRG